MSTDPGRSLLADPAYQAEQAYNRWQEVRHSSRLIKPRQADWRTTLLPFAERIAALAPEAMRPFQLIGGCGVYRDQDGSTPLRDDYTFFIGGSQQVGGPSVYLGRWKGLINKRLDDIILAPSSATHVSSRLLFEACYPEVLSDAGGVTRTTVQFVRAGLPVLRLAWSGPDRHRSSLIDTVQLFVDALNQ